MKINKDNLTLELPNFEGPLDLLLHLIQSQKIDIYDIPIAQITSQYLDYLKKMQQLNLQIAGEYFVMSSTLLRIKSQYLLPKNDFVEDDVQEDPRDELVQQLVQYSVFKKISQYFKKRNEEAAVVVAKEASVSKEQKIKPLPLGQITPEELSSTFSLIDRKLRLKKPDFVSIEVKETPIDEMIDYLQKRIEKEGKVTFFSCIPKMNNLSDVIGLFLPSLELCKKHLVVLSQNRSFGDLNIERINENDK